MADRLAASRNQTKVKDISLFVRKRPQSDRASDSLSHPAATRRGVKYDPGIRLQRSRIPRPRTGGGVAHPADPTQKAFRRKIFTRSKRHRLPGVLSSTTDAGAECMTKLDLATRVGVTKASSGKLVVYWLAEFVCKEAISGDAKRNTDILNKSTTHDPRIFSGKRMTPVRA